MGKHDHHHYGLREFIGAVQTQMNLQILCVSESNKNIIKGKLVVEHTPGLSGPGRLAFVQIYSASQVDPMTETGKGTLSEKAELKHGKSKDENGTKTTTYRIKFQVESDFGIPGALLIQNKHKHKFFLRYAFLQLSTNQLIHFDCNSWVYPLNKTSTPRIFFSNTSYLPKETPIALRELRKEELKSLRGDGKGERQEWDRIYDYDVYNCRHVLGGSESHPYPRRGRTGKSEETQPGMINLEHVYVPPDERFSPKKMSELIENSIQAAVHFIIPEAKSAIYKDPKSFCVFDEILDLYSSNRSHETERAVLLKLKNLLPADIFKQITSVSKQVPKKFTLPQIIADDELAWKNDDVFAHQTLAGINPIVIRVVKSIQEIEGFLPKLEKSDIAHSLEGLSLHSAIQERRIFILDHQEHLKPFIDGSSSKRMDSEKLSVYASQTLFFSRSDATLKTLAITLSEGLDTRVFLPVSQGTDAALWHMARAHVAANDSLHHQLGSHWLHTHAVVEPFIIATRRQLSAMHPIHRLLDPHFKDTMHINALARNFLICSGGVLEKILQLGKNSMDYSSELYKKWRFDEQALPVDLQKRNMALEDKASLTSVRTVFQDYPYGTDGLEIWGAIQTWVTDFCQIFYKDDESVKQDEEIQAWWSEIREVGHGDKCNETWWYQMENRSELIKTLTTLIWITSALHASINFGQYAYAGYPPNRPAACRGSIPREGTEEYAEFLRDPDNYYLKMLPDRFQMALYIAVMNILSQHTSDEVYMGQRPSWNWTDNEEVLQKFKNFSERLKEIEKEILKRNEDPQRKNRVGPAKIPYTFLYPNTSKVGQVGGITGRGIPNSISI